MRFPLTLVAAALVTSACTKYPSLDFATSPVSMPQALKTFPLEPQTFHDCRFVMFRDGTPAERSNYMQALISNSLQIYDMENAAARRAKIQSDLKKRILTSLESSGLDEAARTAVGEITDHEDVEFSPRSVYVPNADAAEEPEKMDLWGFIRRYQTAKTENNTADLELLNRALRDPKVLEKVSEEDAAASANKLFAALHQENLLDLWLEWSALRFQNSQLNGEPLASIDAATYLYNYQRTDIQVGLGKDANGQPWLTIDDWMLNAIPDPDLRDTTAEDKAEESYRFASNNAPDVTDRTPGIQDLVYNEEGGVLKFSVKTPGSAQFNIKVWRSKYNAPDGRTYMMGELVRVSPSGAIRRGTVRWIDRLLSEVLGEADEAALR